MEQPPPPNNNRKVRAEVSADALLATGATAVMASAEGDPSTLFALRDLAKHLDEAVNKALRMNCKRCSVLGETCECKMMTVGTDAESDEGAEDEFIDAECERCQCASFGVCIQCDEESDLSDYDVVRCCVCEDLLCTDCSSNQCGGCPNEVCASCELSPPCSCGVGV